MAFEQVDWRKLMQAISQGTCTPFIGAGACAGYLPTSCDLAEALAEDEGFVINSSRKDLAAVTQYMAVNHADGNYPKREIADIFGFRDPRPEVISQGNQLARLYEMRKAINGSSEDIPHALLADLRSAIYLTTNYDDFMYKALTQRATINGINSPRWDLCRWTNTLFDQRRSPFDGSYSPTRKDPIVYHLHGHADVPESIVVSEDDYIDFTVNISGELAYGKNGIGKKVRLPMAIRMALRNNTLLFVGYHVADQNLHVILRLLFKTLTPSEEKLNLAIQLSPQTDDKDLEILAKIQKYLEDRYRWSLKVQVYWGDAVEFAHELRRRVNNRLQSTEGNAA